MKSLVIDLQGVTPSLLHPTDNPVLSAALAEAINPTRPMTDGTGFDSRL